MRVLALLVIPLALVLLSVARLGAAGYLPIELHFPGTATALTSAALQLVAGVSAACCLGWWVLVVFITPRRGRDRMVLGAHREFRPMFWTALLWGAASTALVVVDGSDAAGRPLSSLARGGTVGSLIHANELPRAWIVVAVCAFAIAGLALLMSSWDFVPLVVILGFVAVLAPVVITQVLIGPNHDYGSDLATIGTPTFTVLAGVLIALRCGGHILTVEPLAQVRVRRVVLIGAAVTVLTDIGVAWFELAGTAPWSNATGRWFIARDLLILAAAGFAVRRTRFSSPGKPADSAGSAARSLPGQSLTGQLQDGAAALLILLAIAATVVRQRIPSPQYFVPTSTAQKFFGFDLRTTPHLFELVFDWRINILFLVISVVAIVAYLLGVLRLHRRGDHWPPGRTVAWICGWVVVVLTTSSGLGRYAGAVFSVHMALHMSLNMLGPLLMVLGGPTTLALRATRSHARSEPAGPHEWLTVLLKSRFLSWLYNPLEVFAVFILSYYVLYFSPLFADTLRFQWAHQLAYLHFILAGYLFYGLTIGVDPPPRTVPYLGKLGLILAAMPFHAFFGVIVMTRDTVIAKSLYTFLNEPWMTDLPHDQYVGGGIAWAAGEFPLVIIIIALVMQWSRQDARVAKRVDRHLDSGADSSFDAYNEMLARMGAPSKGPVDDDR